MHTTIYADHAATTPLSPGAAAAMRPWLQDRFGNPSTLYSLAYAPRRAITSAREVVASCIGAEAQEIFFTSGGTEADNWALAGVAFQSRTPSGRFITSKIEHHAILHTCAFLERLGYDVDYLPVDQAGVVSKSTLEDRLRAGALLVSIMMANNEIGTIQPVKELAASAHEHGCLFHTDAVQAVGHIPIDVKALGVDMLSASAHKFNGPKGIGFLYIRDGVTLEPLLHGGMQERGQRAGTENVAGIVGMAEALQEHQVALDQEIAYTRMLSDALVSTLRQENLDFIINGSDNRIPGSLSLSFPHVDGETLLHRLDLMGIAVATGSACDSKSTALSHVIQSIGVPEAYSHGTIRVTLGPDNDVEQARYIARQIGRILNGTAPAN